jgi:hypothetical protein
MMTQIKTEVEGIVRDTTNGALLNKNNDALVAYKRTKQKNAELEDMKRQVNTLNSEVADVKSLLHKILEKIG